MSVASPRRFAGAVAISAGIILFAPFADQVRRLARRLFPDDFALVVAVLVGFALASGVLSGVRAAWRNRRLGVLAAAVALGVVYAQLMQTGNADVDAVEMFHFLEYGLLTLFFYRAWRFAGGVEPLVMPILAALLVGTLDEWCQWLIPFRVGEARDVFLNAAAIACGLLFSVATHPVRAAQQRSTAAMVRLGVVTLAVFAAFFVTVHVGYDVSGRHGDTFRSTLSKEELIASAVDRSDRWHRQPPMTVRRLSAEDRYLSEGLWHVQRRNQLMSQKDIAGALRENRLLEEFFAPVLDTPSYVSPERHRWTNEMKPALPAGQPASPSASDAHPYPIYAWP